MFTSIVSSEIDRSILQYIHESPNKDLNEDKIKNSVAEETGCNPDFAVERLKRLKRAGVVNHSSQIEPQAVQILSNYESIEATERLINQQKKSSAVETGFTIALLVSSGIQLSNTNVVPDSWIIYGFGAVLAWASLIGGRNLIEVTLSSLKSILSYLQSAAASLKR